ncbi:MAG TPA: hypothetical protein VEA69_21075 [Tepidisphaeraceae bacterium]|nr:hypothetical protein [Tepidisphaeraceae bacterium]
MSDVIAAPVTTDPRDLADLIEQARAKATQGELTVQHGVDGVMGCARSFVIAPNENVAACFFASQLNHQANAEFFALAANSSAAVVAALRRLADERDVWRSIVGPLLADYDARGGVYPLWMIPYFDAMRAALERSNGDG